MSIRTITPALIGLLIAGCASAQAPGAGEDHSAHHPAGAAATPAPPAAGRPAPPAEAFERQIRSMQDMHQRMQAAKTPAERAALMDEHMKLMQSGMAMMGAPAAPSANPGMPGMMGTQGMMGMHDRMERRMAMMEQMMQMMLDREAAMPRR